MGIIHETTTGYTPQSNGVTERKNRNLQQIVNSMLYYSSMSEGFWGETILMGCHILNELPSRTNKKTTNELWYKRKPNLNYLKFGTVRSL